MIEDDREVLSDVLDKGAYVAANLVTDGLARVRRCAELEQQRLGPPTGFCMFCREEAAMFSRFCDFDCSAGWQREQDAARRNIPVE